MSDPVLPRLDDPQALAEAQAAAHAHTSRIITAESLQAVGNFALEELHGARPVPPQRRLSTADLNNEAARQAYALGRKRGFEQGAQMGLQQGYSEGSQALAEFQSRKAADLARQMGQILDAFRGEMKLLETQVASDLVSLAVDIAREVLRRELATDPAALLPAAREALRSLGEGATHVEIHLHPADAEHVAEHLEGVQSGRVRVREDEDLPRGSCRVEADTGIAEAGFEARWQAVMASLGRDEEPAP